MTKKKTPKTFWAAEGSMYLGSKKDVLLDVYDGDTVWELQVVNTYKVKQPPEPEVILVKK